MKINEAGRSMIEMLGVLAIIGIISVSAIKGFSMAMNKLKANEIGELIAEVSVTAQTNNQCLNLSNENDFLQKLDGFQKPKCVQEISGGRTGQVKITFTNDKGCADVEHMVSMTFGKCRWVEKDEGTYLFVPTGGNKCSGSTCTDECETPIQDSCLGA